MEDSNIPHSKALGPFMIDTQSMTAEDIKGLIHKEVDMDDFELYVKSRKLVDAKMVLKAKCALDLRIKALEEDNLS